MLAYRVIHTEKAIRVSVTPAGYRARVGVALRRVSFAVVPFAMMMAVLVLGLSALTWSQAPPWLPERDTPLFFGWLGLVAVVAFCGLCVALVMAASPSASDVMLPREVVFMQGAIEVLPSHGERCRHGYDWFAGVEGDERELTIEFSRSPPAWLRLRPRAVGADAYAQIRLWLIESGRLSA